MIEFTSDVSRSVIAGRGMRGAGREIAACRSLAMAAGATPDGRGTFQVADSMGCVRHLPAERPGARTLTEVLADLAEDFGSSSEHGVGGRRDLVVWRGDQLVATVTRMGGGAFRVTNYER